MIRHALLVPFVLLPLAWGCAGQKQAEEPRVLSERQLGQLSSDPPVSESVDVPLTELQRAEVVRVVDAGLGHFLQEFEVEAYLADGVFKGFRIVRFVDPAKWRGVGLLAGDVVVGINDAPIERPDQAHAAFVALRTAPALEVSYLRDGRPMRLSLPIVGEAPPPAPASPEAKAASPAATSPAAGAPPAAAPGKPKPAR